MPVTVLTIAVSGLALMGVVPSGAYLAKKLLLDAAGSSGQWWWTVVLQVGAVFTAGYVVLVLVNVLRRPSGPVALVKQVPRLAEFAALGLALCSLLLAVAALGPLPAGLLKNPLAPAELASTLLVFLGGALLALGLSHQSLFVSGRGAGAGRAGWARRAMVALGVAFERADQFVRRWTTAGLVLITLAALFGWLLAAR
jgi:NADH:ubiquinone oxidoreductase subunit 5 (subunit L)/multisubunit Na+/H+ antiporter MnhA subunit